MQRILKTALAALLFVTATTAISSSAQTVSVPQTPALEIAFTYQGTLSEPVNGSRFWMQGGAAQLHGRFYGGWGVVADVSGAHIANIHSTGVGLDLVTATFGPRYTWQPAHARYSIYGQGLVGIANGLNGVFPNSAGLNTASDSMAVKTGGGMNLDLKPHLALRLFEADYLRTQLPNATNNVQNNFQLGAGVMLRFR
jgi:outer membrane immunogenic protein